MMNLLRRPLLVGGLTMLALASPARSLQAALVTFNFSGTINSINDPRNIFGGSVRLGDAYTGSLIYESTATGSTPDPTVSFYNFGGVGSANPLTAPLGMIIRIGSSTVIQTTRRFDSLTLGVFNNARTTFGGTADGFSASQEVSFFGATNISADLFLGDRSSQIYSSTALPTSLNPGNFTDGEFSVRDLNDVVNTTTLERRMLLGGTINGINTGAIPEPASLILTGLGLAGVVAVRRRNAA